MHYKYNKNIDQPEFEADRKLGLHLDGVAPATLSAVSRRKLLSLT